MSSEKAIIVTACDSGFFGLAREMVQSVLEFGLAENCSFGCMDLGLTPDEVAEFQGMGVQIVEPKTLLVHGFDPAEARRKGGYLARAFLRENFPGYDIYVWLDADVWIQTPDAIATLIGTAAATGSAFIHENEKTYSFRGDLLGWRLLNFMRGYGRLRGLWLTTKPHINNGVFAMRADAPHWPIWHGYHQEALTKTGRAAPFDQFGLNAAVYLKKLPSTFLPATFNWICDFAIPVLSEESGLFCSPDKALRPISVVHLAGEAKKHVFDIRTTSGNVIRRRLRYKSGAEESAA